MFSPYSAFSTFYLRSSLHLALSATAFARITQIELQLPFQVPLLFFTFLSTWCAYNFIKYHHFFWQGIGQTKRLWLMALLFLFSMPTCCLLILAYSNSSKICAGFIVGLVILYALPVYGRNFRNIPGLKIYLIVLAWTFLTAFLPLLVQEPELNISRFDWLYLLCRFLLVFVMVLISDIADLPKDSPQLFTIPQQIGIAKTKRLGFVLLALYVVLATILLHHGNPCNHLLVGTTLAIFLYYSSATGSWFYTHLYADGLPIFWWIITESTH